MASASSLPCNSVALAVAAWTLQCKPTMVSSRLNLALDAFDTGKTAVAAVPTRQDAWRAVAETPLSRLHDEVRVAAEAEGFVFGMVGDAEAAADVHVVEVDCSQISVSCSGVSSLLARRPAQVGLWLTQDRIFITNSDATHTQSRRVCTLYRE